MKKILIVAMALVAFASCSKDETVARPEGAVIGFENAFVDNTTRAAADINADNLADFGVYGTVSKTGNEALIFANQKVEKVGGVFTYSPAQYWVDDAEYTFAAFAPYTGAQWAYAPTNAYNGTLSFDNAAALGEQDLIFATAKRTTGTITAAPDAVGLTFSHLLSKVAFKFTNAFTDGNITLKVYNVKVNNAAAQGTMSVVDGVDGEWTGAGDYARSFGVAAADEAVLLANGGGNTTTEHFYLIPVEREYNITFDVTLYQAGVELQTYNHEVVAVIDMEKGKNYSVNASLTPENVNPDSSLFPIEFKVDEVENWVDINSPVYAGKTVYVSTAEEFAAALRDPDVTAVVLTEDITYGDTLTRAEGENVIAKSFVLDGGGKTLTYTGGSRAIDIVSEVENATAKNVAIKNVTINCTASYLERGINYNANGTLIIDGVKFTGTAPSYAVNFPGMADNAIVKISNSEITGKIALNVWGENMKIDVENSVLNNYDDTEVENYSTVKLNNDGTNIADGTVINIKNSKVTATDENGEPAVAIYNASNTGAIVVDDATEVIGSNEVQVAIVYFEGSNNSYGCSSLANAIASFKKHNAAGIRITRDIELTETLVVAKDENIILDLGGKTISGVDTTSKNFSLIDNRGTLTIFGGGKITIEATVNSGWNRYSAVIANNPGGTLNVKDVTIEHLGGTDMAYGIDNLTNGKGTYAVTTIEGATVKSSYRAVRQFLNGVEATNELYVKAGSTLEGANKGIFFHDPSTKANTGKLVVESGAYVGSVYLFVTAGSTEWPVEVSIAADAVAEGGVIWGNVPNGYIVTNKGGYWVVDTATTANDATELKDAISNADGEATICLAAGTYEMPSIGGKDITIVGTEDTVIKSNKVNLGNGNLTLDGVTITAGSYNGFQHSGVVTYNNATIKGQINCYGVKDIFNNCTFELDNTYVWTYGSAYTEFNNCTFNTTGKAILIYNEGDDHCNVTVKNCTFNATAGAKASAIANQNCAAIEIDNYASRKHQLTTSGNTYSENFSGEWRIKRYIEGAPITVNGVEYTYIALDGKKMTIDDDNNVTVVE